MGTTGSSRPARATPRQQNELARLLTRLAPAEGTNPTPRTGLDVLRADQPRARGPVVYQPSLNIVAQGSKRAYLGTETFVYDPLHYLVLSVPLPLEAEIVDATPERPYLGLRLQLQSTELSDLLIEAGDGFDRRCNSAAQRGICLSPLNEALYGAVLRLVAALGDDRDRRVLAPLAEREVLYHVLAGEQGKLLREVALRDSRSHRIAEVLRYLQAHYDQPLDIPTIADVANMSPSTLHHTFKEVTCSSPLQYLKSVRLHQARLLMLQDGLGASEAGHRVGYGSASQFSREYRRLFGVPPSRDVASLRAD